MTTYPIEIDFDYEVEDFKKVNDKKLYFKAKLGIVVNYDELNPQDFTIKIFNELGNQDITKEVMALNYELFEEIQMTARLKMIQHSIDEENNPDFMEVL